MVFLTENWFWRGTQSAIFYYASCTPYVEYKHKKKRKREAAEAYRQRDKAAIELAEARTQPAPFETNEEWAHEILRGPGPPKGWKKDSVYHKYAKKMREVPDYSKMKRSPTISSTCSPSNSDSITTCNTVSTTFTVPDIIEQDDKDVRQLGNRATILGTSTKIQDNPERAKSLFVNTKVDHSSDDVSLALTNASPETAPETAPETFRTFSSSISNVSDPTASKRASFDSEPEPRLAVRPSMERRLSSAMENFKDAMRMTLHPEKWNWVRYDRDDEILSNINERMRSMWESMKEHMIPLNEEQAATLRRTATSDTAESEARKWQRGFHPAINELHPPIVSQLPATRDEARWMLLPPPSADVMMGKRRPDPFEDMNRKPLCVLGRSPRTTKPEPSCPALSSEEISSDDYDSEDSWDERSKVPGWTSLQSPLKAHVKPRISSTPS